MGRLLNSISRVVETTASLHISKFKSKYLQSQKWVKKISAAVRKSVQETLHFALGKPSSVQDYIHVTDTYFSKQFLLKVVIFLVAIIFLWIKVGYPYLNGRLWPAKLIVNTAEFHEFTGEGKVYRKNGVILYQGELQNGTIEGLGDLYDKEGELIYHGGFSNNAYTGEGELYEKGVLLYKGEFANNQYQGEGQLFYEDGNVKFSGNFEAGVYQDGVEYYRSGNKKYTGTFENGLYTGEATFFEDNANNDMRYSGTFVKGKYEGNGFLYDDGKLLYKGGFSNQKYEGEGSIYRDEIVIYEGEFRNGRKNGEGRAYSNQGEYLIYEGEFKDDCYDGIGTLYNRENGKMIYTGEFLRGTYQGTGKLYNGGGRLLYEGIFHQGNIQYLNFTNAEETEIQDAFGVPEDTIFLDSTYLLPYRELGVAFELGYVDMEETPQVERIRFWGDQIIDGVSREMTVEEFTRLFEEDGLYTEYVFSAGESETAVSAYMEKDIQPGDEIYAVKCIRDGYYIRVYGTGKKERISYFEVGGI